MKNFDIETVIHLVFDAFEKQDNLIPDSHLQSLDCGITIAVDKLRTQHHISKRVGLGITLIESTKSPFTYSETFKFQTRKVAEVQWLGT